ncbi:MAG: ankyrin repeat domain-containing protein, partial [Planctomycetota bacterium]
MNTSRSPLPLIILLLCLVGVSAGLFYWTQSLHASVDQEASARTAPSALHDAAAAGNAEAIATALKNGAAIEGRIDRPGQKQGMTALMVAAQAGKPVIVNALIKAGAKSDAA